MIDVRVNNSYYFNGIMETNVGSFSIETEQFKGFAIPLVYINGIPEKGGVSFSADRQYKMSLNLGPLKKGDVIEAFMYHENLNKSKPNLWDVFTYMRADYGNRMNQTGIPAIVDDPIHILLEKEDNLPVTTLYSDRIEGDIGRVEYSDEDLSRFLANSIINERPYAVGGVGYFSKKRYAEVGDFSNNVLTQLLLRTEKGYFIAQQNKTEGLVAVEGDNLKLLLNEDLTSYNRAHNKGDILSLTGNKVIHFPNDYYPADPMSYLEDLDWSKESELEGFLKRTNEGGISFQPEKVYFDIEYYRVHRDFPLQTPTGEKKMVGDDGKVVFDHATIPLDGINHTPVIRIAPGMPEDELKKYAPYLWDIMVSSFKNSHATSFKFLYLLGGDRSFIRSVYSGRDADVEIRAGRLFFNSTRIEETNFKRAICRDDNGYFMVTTLNNLPSRLDHSQKVIFVELENDLADDVVDNAWGMNTEIPDHNPEFIFYIDADETDVDNQHRDLVLNLNCAYEGRAKGSNFIDWKEGYEDRDYFLFEGIKEANRADLLQLRTTKGGFSDIKRAYFDHLTLFLEFNPKFKVDVITIVDPHGIDTPYHYLKDFTCVDGKVAIDVPDVRIGTYKIIVGYREVDK